MPSVREVILRRREGEGEGEGEYNVKEEIFLFSSGSIFLLHLAIAIGIKSHVLLNYSEEFFNRCGQGGLWGYAFITTLAALVGFCLGFCLGLFQAGCGDSSIDGSRITTLIVAGVLAAATAIFAYWIVVGFIQVVRILFLSDRATSTPFFAEFYSSLDYGNCTTGEQLEGLKLAEGVFKVEAFIVGLILVMLGLSFLYCCYLDCRMFRSKTSSSRAVHHV